MKTTTPRSTLLTLLIFITFPILTLHADDTDIYLAAESSGDSRSQYESNILFIMDTSGSMDDGKIGEYDPEIDYIQELEDLGISHTCEREKMYRTTSFSDKTDDDTPSGNFITGHGISCSDSLMFYAEDLDCRAANNTSQPINLEEHGFYVDQVQEYTGLSWQNLTTSGPANRRKVSCRADSGRAVEGSATLREYLADSGTGWSTSSADEIDWTDSDYEFHIVYSANYLAWRNDYIRIKVLNKVFNNTINDLNTGNVGVMRFSHSDGGQGGMVIHAMDHISGTKSALTALSNYHFTVEKVDGATPLAETLWEAYNYYSGSAVDTGDDAEPITSVDASRLPGDSSYYQTPIQKACQKNFVVYLSDGEAAGDNTKDDEIRELTGSECSFGSEGDGDNCLDDLAAWMSTNDITPSIGAIGDPDEIQTVTTHTIGFGIDTQLLRDTASGSGGRYFSASSASELKAAFDDILREVTADSGSFTPPAVSVNSFFRLTHRNDLYFTVFKPSVNSHWDGNLKKYRLKKINGELKIVDAAEMPAVNEIDGTFRPGTRSFWTPADETDGDDVAKGGAASQLALTLKNETDRPRTALGSNNISDAVNLVDETNTTNMTKTVLDIASEDDTFHTRLLEWISGMDKKDIDNDGDRAEVRKQLGDPLHTQPTIVTYGGTEAAPDVTVFMTTNDGFLHAFDAETGQEQAAYIPAELLKNQKLAFDESQSSGKLYGLDGGITPWVYDINKNSIIEGGDHVYLYIGMRRGGTSYYAVDVTNRNAPQLMWQIDSSMSNFARLGQTWSKPALATINIGGTETKVLIFGGGFDDGGTDGKSEDDLLSPPEHDIGNAIYIVDAKTGTRLYAASNQTVAGVDEFSEMDFAIPSDLTVLDVNADGLHDRIYVGDLGGQLWRFDINNGQSGTGLLDGAVIAKLGRTAAGAVSTDHRRFFNRPDVSLIADEINGTFLSIAIGSGRRNEPTDNDIQDRFFSVWDKNVYAKPATYPAAVAPADLHDATDNLVSEGTTGAGGTQETAVNELAAGKGWFIDLEHGDASGRGEKALSSSITLDNQILFTTYVPAGSEDPTSCDAGTGSGRFYAVKVATAEPVTHYEWNDSGADEDPTRNDRSKKLAKAGIPSSPIALFPEANDGELAVMSGTEIQDISLRQRTRKTYWYVEEE